MKVSVALAFCLVAFASPLAAQAKTRASSNADIPKAERPPAGMCRIWLDDVPAAQQPAATDCPTAVRNRPAKGRVIFGDDYVTSKRSDSTKGKSPIKGFAPTNAGKKRPLAINFP
jgi:hypothetical protein